MKELRIKNTEFITIIKKLSLVIFTLFFNFSTYAQCAMCRASLEGEGNAKKAAAVNDGIVYLMVIPYILAGFVAIIIYRMYSSRKKTI
jgi:hypothetical protein